MKNAKYFYFYAMSTISLIILLWATADLLRIFLDQLLRYPPYELLSDYDRLMARAVIMPPGRYPIPINFDDIAVRLAAILVSLPVYIFHWFKTSGDILKSKLDELTPGELSKRKTFTQIVLIINSLTMLFGTIWILYLILRNLFSSIDFALLSLSMPVSYIFVAFFSFVYHWIILKDADSRIEKLPATQTFSIAGETKFCGYCAAQNRGEFTYCVKCGKKLN